MKNIFNRIPSVCRLHFRQGDFLSHGNGVFVSPRHIITAAHVLRNVGVVGVNNRFNQQAFATLALDPLNDGDGLDIALIEIGAPLSASFTAIARKFDAGDRLTLASRDLSFVRDGTFTKTLPGRVKTIGNNPNFILNSAFRHIPFLWFKNIRSGMSGSPALNSRGEVVSILSHLETPTVGMFEYQNAAGQWIRETLGPNPIRFMDFMDPYRDEIELACEAE